MTVGIVGLLGLLGCALILLWASWRFGASLRPTIWLRCLLGFSMLTTVASMTAGWMHVRLVSPWMAAWMIGVREEGIKLLFFLVMADRDPDTRSAGDRLLAMTAVALGFAVPEAIGKSMPYGGLGRVLIAFYVDSFMGIAVHVFLSLQAAGFLILSRLRSRLWLVGIVAPMALHAIWDNTILIGVSAPEPVLVLRIAIIAGAAILALGLARAVRACPGNGISHVAGPSALLVWLLGSTMLQVIGMIGWPYGLTVKPYSPLIAAWWVAGFDMVVALYLSLKNPFAYQEVSKG